MEICLGLEILPLWWGELDILWNAVPGRLPLAPGDRHSVVHPMYFSRRMPSAKLERSGIGRIAVWRCLVGGYKSYRYPERGRKEEGGEKERKREEFILDQYKQPPHPERERTIEKL